MAFNGEYLLIVNCEFFYVHIQQICKHTHVNMYVLYNTIIWGRLADQQFGLTTLHTIIKPCINNKSCPVVLLIPLTCLGSIVVLYHGLDDQIAVWIVGVVATVLVPTASVLIGPLIDTLVSLDRQVGGCICGDTALIEVRQGQG